MKMKKILIIGVVIGVALAGYGLFMYFAPVQSLQNAKSDASLSSEELVLAYETDESAANQEYLNKVIEVSGKIKDIVVKEGVTTVELDANHIMSSVLVELEPGYDISTVRKGDNVVLKGVCTGYLMDVVLVQGVIVVK